MPWRTIFNSRNKRVMVRSGKPRHGRPPVHIHKTTVKGDDWSGVAEFVFGAVLVAVTVWLVLEFWPVILGCVIVAAFLAICSK